MPFSQQSEQRVLCPTCARSVVSTRAHVEKCRKVALYMLRNVGFYGIPDDIPIALRSEREMGDNLGSFSAVSNGYGDILTRHIEMVEGLPEL